MCWCEGVICVRMGWRECGNVHVWMCWYVMCVDVLVHVMCVDVDVWLVQKCGYVKIC